MRVLVMGGSLFNGRSLVEELVAAGHEVTVCNRGKTPDARPGGVDRLVADRTDHDAVAEYPILSGAEESLARAFGAYGFPALVIVAPDGGIESVHLGLTSAEELTELTAPLLEAAPPIPEAG